MRELKSNLDLRRQQVETPERVIDMARIFHKALVGMVIVPFEVEGETVLIARNKEKYETIH